MKLNKSLLVNISLGLLIASALLFLSQKGLLKHAEITGLDFSFYVRNSIPYNKHIVIVEITDSDISKIGRWPWKRSWHAAITQALKTLGAKYIYFDIIFSEPSDENDDRLFEEAIKLSENAYLPFVFTDTSYNIKNTFAPIPRFANYMKGTGAINIYPDIDGTLRKIPLIFKNKNGVYPHAALKIAMDYAGLTIKEIDPGYLILEGPGERIRLPLIDNHEMLVNWTGRWKDTFKHYSFLDVLNAYQDYLENKPTQINIEDFKDSICLVAVTAIGLYDIKPTPLEPEYPGIGVMANTISNILTKNFLHLTANWFNILLLYVFTLLPAFLIFGDKPLREAISVLAIGGVYLLLNFLLFARGEVINLFTPLLGIITSGLTIGTYNFFRVAVERQNFFKLAVTDGLTNLINIRYFKMLLETEILMARQDPSKIFTIIMSDVDHFKKFNDTYGHQIGDLVLREVSNVLKNSVRSSDIVARYGGEEMIVLLRGTPISNGLAVAEKIRKNIESSIVKDEKGKNYNVTVSLGVSSFKPNDNVDTLIKRADDGLYQAKESGRNRVGNIENS